MTGLALFQHIIVWLPLVVGGIFLIRAGLRGRRVNDHPVCRRCRFDLVGLGGGTRPERCPECGESLTGTTRKARRAIIDGERKRRWWAFSFGVVLLLAGLGTGFWLTYKPLAKFPWTTWAPDWVLAEMVDSTNTARADGVIRELMLRITRAEIGAPDVDRAVNRALRAQADLGTPWNPELGNLIEVAREKGLVNETRWKQYARQAVVIDLRVRERIAPGSHIPYRVSHVYRVGSRETLLSTGPNTVSSHPPLGMRLADAGAVVDGKEQEYPAGASMTAWGIRASMGSEGAMSGGAYFRGLKPGPCTVELRFDATVFAPSPDDARVGEIDPSTIVATWRDSKSFLVTVVPEHEELVRLVKEPTLVQTMRASLRPSEFRIDTSYNNQPTLTGTIDIGSPPVAGSFDAVGYLTRGDGSVEEISMMGVKFLAGASTSYQIFGAPSRPVTGDVSLRLVLRPSISSAERSVDLVEIWGEEIVYENIPIALKDK